MTVTIKNGKMNRAELRLEIDMLRALVIDLECIWLGGYPDERELNDAPLITNWKASTRAVTCLEGIMIQHPRLGNIVANGITSELWLLDLDRDYVRTFSRFYRLGEKTSTSLKE